MSPPAATGRSPSEEGRPLDSPGASGHKASEAAVDVTRLMDEIRERVRERRASGFYSEDEVRRIAQMEIELSESAPTFQDEMEQHLARLNDGWDTAAAPVVTSHRLGIGRIIVGGKRLLWRLTRPYVALILARQVDWNSTLLHLLNAFVLPARDGMTTLTRRLEDLSLDLHERLTVEHGERQGGQRELAERLRALGGELERLRSEVERLRQPAAPARLAPSPAAPAELGTLPPAAYVRFEDRHRGPREEIRERQRVYLDLFAGAAPVLDVGCGRGEFLELCREAGIEARGVDMDAGMVAGCREAGLAVEQADALAALEKAPDKSLGGVFCAQVIEHLVPETLIALVRLAYAKLRPGGILLCETPNPASLTVFSGAFYVDLTHVKPIHPEAARFVLEAAGFHGVEIRFVNPVPADGKLQPLEPLWYMRRYEEAFLGQINANLERLNQLLWGAQDYAVIGRRP
jgi:O-antigen chain-terminating methyltransferase